MHSRTQERVSIAALAHARERRAQSEATRSGVAATSPSEAAGLGAEREPCLVAFRLRASTYTRQAPPVTRGRPDLRVSVSPLSVRFAAFCPDPGINRQTRPLTCDHLDRLGSDPVVGLEPIRVERNPPRAPGAPGTTRGDKNQGHEEAGVQSDETEH